MRVRKSRLLLARRDTEGSIARFSARTVVGFLAAAVVTGLLAGCGGAGSADGYAVNQVNGEGTAVEFRLRLSEQTVTTSDQLELELETRAAERWKVRFPDIGDSIGEFEVVDTQPEERELTRDDVLVATRQYTLEPALAGEYEIPALELAFGESDGEYPFSIESRPISVTVESVLPPTVGEQEIEEIEGPVSAPFNWVPYAGGAAGLLVLAGAGGLLFVRLRRRSASEAPEPELPPWEAARQELDQLLESELLENREHERFYTRMSDIIRRYVERRFHVHAPEQTTEEFLAAAKQHEALAGHRDALGEFLTRADLVKFARHEPDAEEVDEAVAACRHFIDQTTPGRSV